MTTRRAGAPRTISTRAYETVLGEIFSHEVGAGHLRNEPHLSPGFTEIEKLAQLLARNPAEEELQQFLSSHDRFFHGHRAVEISNQPAVRKGRNHGVAGSPATVGTAEAVLVQLDQRRDIDEWPVPAASDHVTALRNDNETCHGRLGQVCAGLGRCSGTLRQTDRRINSVGKPLLAENTVSLSPVSQCPVDGDDTSVVEFSRHPAPSHCVRRADGQSRDARCLARH